MGKLAELAGATELRGKVCVTDTKGTTHLYESEAEAEAAWGHKAGRLEHRRGGFHEKKPAPPKPQERADRSKSKKKTSGRSRSASSD